LRTHHYRSSFREARRIVGALALPVLLAGCSMSLVDDADIPQTTGSISSPVEVQRPLPPTLAYSDAAKIGQAASAVMAQATGDPIDDWINSTTGSSGTLEPATTQVADAGNCRGFSTIVTSIGGVHRYSGAICQRTSGRSVVQIDERTKDDAI
jgi:hypothetical protein